MRRTTLSKVNHGVQEREYRKRAFYAGRNHRGDHIFTQERGFGSKKPIAFVSVDASEMRDEPTYNYTSKTRGTRQVPVYPFGLSVGPEGEWVVWQETGASSVAVANSAAVTKNNNRSRNNVPTANLLGLNNRPRMSNANNNTRRARENWYKQHAREQELQGLFGGRQRLTRRRTY